MQLPPSLTTVEECLTYAEEWIGSPKRTIEEVAAFIASIRERTREEVQHKISAVALIFNAAQEILLLRRTSTDPAYPETYSFPGGTKNAKDTTLQETVERETKEETGLIGTAGASRGTLHAFIPKRKRVYEINAFEVHLDPTVPHVITLSDEHDDALFITPELALERESEGTLRIAGLATRTWLSGWRGM